MAAARASGLFPMMVPSVVRSPLASASLIEECRESSLPAASRRLVAAPVRLSRSWVSPSRALPLPFEAVDVAPSRDVRAALSEDWAEARVEASDSSWGRRLVS